MAQREKKFNVVAGQKVMLVSHNFGREPTTREAVIEKVGNKWAYFRFGRFDIYSGIAYEGGFTIGQVWLTEAEYVEHKRIQDRWKRVARWFSHASAWHVPDGMTVEKANEILDAVGYSENGA